MAVTSPLSTTTANPAAAAPAATKSAQVGLGDNLNSFLNMLTTQLKNQDPLSPLDTNQFTQQLVSFSQVEQAIKQNDQLKSLVGLLSTSSLADSAGLIGKKVEVDSAEMALGQSGKIDFSYALPATAKETALTITNLAGEIVWTGAGEKSSGAHGFTWDGKTRSGAAAPAGIYKLEVGAARVDGTPMTAPVKATATVEAVTLKDGAAALAFGPLEIPTSRLVGVRN